MQNAYRWVRQTFRWSIILDKGVREAPLVLIQRVDVSRNEPWACSLSPSAPPPLP